PQAVLAQSRRYPRASHATPRVNRELTDTGARDAVPDAPGYGYRRAVGDARGPRGTASLCAKRDDHVGLILAGQALPQLVQCRTVTCREVLCQLVCAARSLPDTRQCSLPCQAYAAKIGRPALR